MRGTCSSCEFYSAMSNECRKDPPTATVVMTEKGPVTLGVFPASRSTNWCGAWAPQVYSGGATAPKE